MVPGILATNRGDLANEERLDGEAPDLNPFQAASGLEVRFMVPAIPATNRG